MKILILDPKLGSAKEQMDIDEHILSTLDPNGQPILRHYDWKQDSITYGVFAKPEKLFHFKALKKYHIDIAKRVTGGGATLHFSDLAFSFFLPKNHPKFSENVLENYAWVNSLVAKALSKWLEEKELIYATDVGSKKSSDPLFFCMAKLTQYDVIYHNKKIAGAAQRKKNQGLLHHGSIAIAAPDPKILSEILVDPKACEDILNLHHYFVDSHLKREAVQKWRTNLRHELNQVFIQALRL